MLCHSNVSYLMIYDKMNVMICYKIIPLIFCVKCFHSQKVKFGLYFFSFSRELRGAYSTFIGLCIKQEDLIDEHS